MILPNVTCEYHKPLFDTEIVFCNNPKSHHWLFWEPGRCCLQARPTKNINTAPLYKLWLDRSPAVSLFSDTPLTNSHYKWEEVLSSETVWVVCFSCECVCVVSVCLEAVGRRPCSSQLTLTASSSPLESWKSWTGTVLRSSASHSTSYTFYCVPLWFLQGEMERWRCVRTSAVLWGVWR